MNLIHYCYVRFLRFLLWYWQCELAIGEATGMGLPYKTMLRSDIAELEGTLDRAEVLR